ncbi:MAG TPA: glycoside hydrolase domain-containing protein [Anaerolineales bacterium]|nr:glycoside hydrolase domain-containing protein [Anaerolineales bacterium]
MKTEVHLERFDLLTATSGWVLLDQHLFWTSDAGQSWEEIGPSIPSGALIQDVRFIDSNTGWLLWTSSTPESNGLFQLAHTMDHGLTWTIRSLPLFEAGEIASYAEKAKMGWFDTQTGWISVKQNSGSNFSMGTLFRTSDGGITWSRFPLPVADQVAFSDAQVGWAIGGPAGDQVFKTNDAGATWQDVKLDDLPANSQVTVYMPYYSLGEGLLALTDLGVENGLRVYSPGDLSHEWLLIDQQTLDVQPGVIALSILDSRNFVATIPGTTSIVRMRDGETDVVHNQDDRSPSIVELDMASPDIGWARSIESNCVTVAQPDERTASVSCSSSTRLLQTIDGGITWQSIHLPLIQSDVISRGFSGINSSLAVSAKSGSGNTEEFIGQGFDTCEIPTISQLQTWQNSSPYKTINLYIGGSSRACDNTALSATYLSKLYQQGWMFIPTWVGPQAPCTGFRSRFSNDVTTAYNQGVNEANLAVERLAELGLTKPDKTGSVVYYDMEHYGTESACRSAVNAFMNGWVAQIRAHGNLAGVYASTLCNTGLSDFRFLQHVPDVIWPARWYHGLGLGYYDPNASVWNLGSCVPNPVWANHQRIRQYEGAHNETWGNLTLDIDSNVLDGVVAIPDMIPPAAASLVSPSGTITDTTPGYTWNRVDAATWYYLWVSRINSDGSLITMHSKWYESSTVCGSSTCSVTLAGINLAGGNYRWWIQTWNSAGYGPWSSARNFSLPTIDPPVVATLVSPNGSITDTTPEYTWDKVSASTWYYLWVSRINSDGSLTTMHTKWYDATAVCSGATCSITPAGITLTSGNYRWWIQTWNEGGYGPWSSAMNFTVIP